MIEYIESIAKDNLPNSSINSNLDSVLIRHDTGIIEIQIEKEMIDIDPRRYIMNNFHVNTQSYTIPYYNLEDLEISLPYTLSFIKRKNKLFKKLRPHLLKVTQYFNNHLKFYAQGIIEEDRDSVIVIPCYIRNHSNPEALNLIYYKDQVKGRSCYDSIKDSTYGINDFKGIKSFIDRVAEI